MGGLLQLCTPGLDPFGKEWADKADKADKAHISLPSGENGFRKDKTKESNESNGSKWSNYQKLLRRSAKIPNGTIRRPVSRPAKQGRSERH